MSDDREGYCETCDWYVEYSPSEFPRYSSLICTNTDLTDKVGSPFGTCDLGTERLCPGWKKRKVVRKIDALKERYMEMMTEALEELKGCHVRVLTVFCTISLGATLNFFDGYVNGIEHEMLVLRPTKECPPERKVVTTLMSHPDLANNTFIMMDSVYRVTVLDEEEEEVV